MTTKLRSFLWRLLTAVAIAPLLIHDVSFAANVRFPSSYLESQELPYTRQVDDEVCTTESATSVSGNDNISKMWNYFIGKGLKDFQVAGILGNIQQESGFSAFRQEDSKPWPSGGYGIVQWTDGRRRNIETKMKTQPWYEQYYQDKFGGATKESNGFVPDGVPVDINDQILTFQLDYLYQESRTRKLRLGYGPNGVTEWDAIKAAKDLRAASDIWLYSFERPKDQSAEHAQKRAGFGEAILSKMKSQPQPTSNNSETQPSTAALTTGGGDIKYFKNPEKAGATTYGGQYSGGKWSPNNGQQGGGSDDTGMGNDGNPLPGTVSYAELSNNAGAKDFSALGKLPNRTKLAITYEGRTVVAEKRDVGAGSRKNSKVNGVQKKIDLWWETARMLDFKGGSGVVTIQGVPDSTPVTPFSTTPVQPGGAPTTQSKGCSNSAGANFNAGDLQSAVLAYAWPDYKGDGYVTKKNEYQAAVSKADNEGKYTGNPCRGGGVDCGAFVTILLNNSGFDPQYNSSGRGKNTGDCSNKITQWGYLCANWQKLGQGNQIDTATLQPGDVAMQKGHTFVYVGDIPGFNSKIASASMCRRAPMAGIEELNDKKITWFRKKS